MYCDTIDMNIAIIYLCFVNYTNVMYFVFFFLQYFMYMKNYYILIISLSVSKSKFKIIFLLNVTAILSNFQSVDIVM